MPLAESMFFTQLALTASHTPFCDMQKHKTLQSPPQYKHFPDLNLKVGKMNYSLGSLGKPFLKVGKKNIHYTFKAFQIQVDPWPHWPTASKPAMYIHCTKIIQSIVLPHTVAY